MQCFLAPIEPSESGSEVVATTQDSGCGDSEVMVVGAQLESYPSDISNEEDKVTIPDYNFFIIAVNVKHEGLMILCDPS